MPWTIASPLPPALCTCPRLSCNNEAPETATPARVVFRGVEAAVQDLAALRLPWHLFLEAHSWSEPALRSHRCCRHSRGAGRDRHLACGACASFPVPPASPLPNIVSWGGKLTLSCVMCSPGNHTVPVLMQKWLLGTACLVALPCFSPGWAEDIFWPALSSAVAHPGRGAEPAIPCLPSSLSLAGAPQRIGAALPVS